MRKLSSSGRPRPKDALRLRVLLVFILTLTLGPGVGATDRATIGEVLVGDVDVRGMPNHGRVVAVYAIDGSDDVSAHDNARAITSALRSAEIRGLLVPTAPGSENMFFARDSVTGERVVPRHDDVDFAPPSGGASLAHPVHAYGLVFL